MVGLGLALAQPKRRVLVLTGDGEMLMGLGSLATIAVASPGNLALVVLDNEHYAETGMQASHTGAGVDLAGIAGAAGWSPALTVRDEPGLAELAALIRAGRPVFADLKIAASEDPRVLPPRDGAYLQHRFRRALGTAPEFGE